MKNGILIAIIVILSGCAYHQTMDTKSVGILRNIEIHSDSEVVAKINTSTEQQGTIGKFFDGLFGVLEKMIPKITMGH